MHIALICVLIAGLMPYLWTGVAKFAGPRYDNADVRAWQERLTGLPHRAHAAHLNSFEAFPFFAAAVLAALLTGADQQRVAILAIAFVMLRLLYGVIYLTNIAALRSLVWFAALVCPVVIFIDAIGALAGR
jgi:uncharacterized MAPEG superfamily protein